jgi:hypothetical protein
MGNWNLTIRGVGPHDNNTAVDIERQAAVFVESLKKAHTIQSAVVTVGGEKDLESQAYAYLKTEEARANDDRLGMPKVRPLLFASDGVVSLLRQRFERDDGSHHGHARSGRCAAASDDGSAVAEHASIDAV